MPQNESKKEKILIIMTGGTICSLAGQDGKRYSDAKHIRLAEHYLSQKSKFSDSVQFDTLIPMDILSENMTVAMWKVLIDTFKNKVDWNSYRGVIVLHGTDTLSYTTSLLSIVLTGAPIPIMMVSANLPLNEEKTNGYANFKAAVELILNGIMPNVYAVYRNSDSKIYVHFGAHLLQCANHSDDFLSADMTAVSSTDAKTGGMAFETDSMLVDKIKNLDPYVLAITPYVGIDYSVYSLDGVRAIVHGTFHSQTLCVGRSKGEGEYDNFSVLNLIDKANQNQIPVFIAPCNNSAYESTSDAINHGAMTIGGTTFEVAYVKTLVGCALGMDNDKLADFVNTSLNNEIIYK